jgi:hypothetical protein
MARVSSANDCDLASNDGIATNLASNDGVATSSIADNDDIRSNNVVPSNDSILQRVPGSAPGLAHVSDDELLANTTTKLQLAQPGAGSSLRIPMPNCQRVECGFEPRAVLRNYDSSTRRAVRSRARTESGPPRTRTVRSHPGTSTGFDSAGIRRAWRECGLTGFATATMYHRDLGACFSRHPHFLWVLVAVAAGDLVSLDLRLEARSTWKSSLTVP